MAEKTREKRPPAISVDMAQGRGNPVPRVVHQIWLQGRGAMRAEVADLVRQCERVAMAAGWKYRLWSVADLATLPEFAARAHLPQRPAHRSNLGRCAILWRLGGLYVDADVEVYRMPPPLCGAWLMGDNNSVMAAPPRDPWVGDLLEVLGEPAIYETSAGHVRQFREPAAAREVQIWPPGCWNGSGVGGQRYGRHLSRSKRWASHVPER